MAHDQFVTHAELFDLSGKHALVTGGTRGIVRIERGNLAGTSAGVLGALAAALQLNEARNLRPKRMIPPSVRPRPGSASI